MVSSELLEILRCPNCVRDKPGILVLHKDTWLICQDCNRKYPIVDDIPVYATVAETEDVAHSGEDLQAHGADWITFTSGSTVEHFHKRFNLPALLKKFPQTKLASIGPETTKAIEMLELGPAIEAKQHTMEGLVAAVSKAKR